MADGPSSEMPDVVLATDTTVLTGAEVMADAWHARLDAVLVAPIQATPGVTVGVVASTGDRALEPVVVCGMGYTTEEIDALAEAAAARLRREEATWRDRPAPDLADKVVAVAGPRDRYGAVAAAQAARRRHAERILLTGVTDPQARSIGYDGAAPGPPTPAQLPAGRTA